jgi:hypothetical protein
MQTTSPTIVLKTAFGNKPGQTIAEFSKECAALKASCPPDTVGRETSFHDFVEECGQVTGQQVQWPVPAAA